MPDKRVVLWSAACAAVLAFISGLFGRVSFGTILLRTFIGAVVFAGLSAGIYILLKQFVPEIFETAGSPSDEDEPSVASESSDTSSQGSNLNIVIDEEGPSYPAEEQGEGPAHESVFSENDFIEEIREEGDEGAEVADGPMAAETSRSEKPVSNESDILEDYGDISNLDTLPDLEEFSDSFESVTGGQEDDSFSEQNHGSDNKVDMLEGQHDPATVAKAVRTIISRDQEG